MSKHVKRGRPPRQYRIRVRTERRDPIDYAKLAQAALEQAAMDANRDQTEPTIDDRTASPLPRSPRSPDGPEGDSA